MPNSSNNAYVLVCIVILFIICIYRRAHSTECACAWYAYALKIASIATDFNYFRSYNNRRIIIHHVRFYVLHQTGILHIQCRHVFRAAVFTFSTQRTMFHFMYRSYSTIIWSFQTRSFVIHRIRGSLS